MDFRSCDKSVGLWIKVDGIKECHERARYRNGIAQNKRGGEGGEGGEEAREKREKGRNKREGEQRREGEKGTGMEEQENPHGTRLISSAYNYTLCKAASKRIPHLLHLGFFGSVATLAYHAIGCPEKPRIVVAVFVTANSAPVFGGFRRGIRRGLVVREP